MDNDRLVTFGAQSNLISDYIYTNWEVGTYYSPSMRSFLGFYGGGVRVDAGDILAQVGIALGGITSTDEYLGGHLQFTENLFLGLKSHRDAALGAFFKHISSGGISSPNLGRNFVGIEIRIPL